MDFSEIGTGNLCMYAGTGVGACVIALMLLSNVFALVRYVGAERGEAEGASQASLGAWGLSVASFFCGPCGLFTALISLVLARVERNNAFAEDGNAWSLMAASMATTNSIAAIGINLLITVSAAIPYVLPAP